MPCLRGMLSDHCTANSPNFSCLIDKNVLFMIINQPCNEKISFFLEADIDVQSFVITYILLELTWLIQYFVWNWMQENSIMVPI